MWVQQSLMHLEGAQKPLLLFFTYHLLLEAAQVLRKQPKAFKRRRDLRAMSPKLEIISDSCSVPRNSSN